MEVIPSRAERNIVVKLFAKDLDYLGYGGRLVPGLPNSVRTGIQRGGGLMYGCAACRVRGLALVHKVWEPVAIVLGRNPVFDQKFDRDDYVSSFDGVGYTGADHIFTGLKKHRDVYPGEPGQLQMLTYLSLIHI